MNKLIFLAAVVALLPLSLWAQTIEEKDTVKVREISDLTNISTMTGPDSTLQFAAYDPAKDSINERISLAAIIRGLSLFNGIIGSTQITNGSILDTDISGSAGIGLNKLATTGTGRLLLTDSGGSGTWEAGTPGYGLDVSGTSILADTSSAGGLVSKSRLSNALDDVGGGGGLTTVDTTESFTTELAFFENREIGPYQVSGNVTFTVNDSAAVVGAFSTYRMNFGADSLYSVSFSGSEFDSVQQYNINSGDTLTGIHILDFWYTRWGVAVNVPTNGAGFSETSQDTVANPTSNPFQEKSGLLVEFDGFYGRSTSSDTIIWASNEGSPTNRAVSTNLSKKPSYSGTPGMTFANNGAFLDLDTNFSPSSGNVAVTIAWSASGTTANNDFFGQNTDVASFDFHRNGSVSNIFYAWGGISMTPGVLDVGPEIIQLSCNSGTCELWMDGVSKGTDSTGMSDTVITILGSLNKNSSTGVNGTIYHIAVHDNPYTAQERSDAFNYVNDRYSMGL